MRSKTFKSHLIPSGLVALALALGSGASFAQQQLNLTAGPSTATLPDGSQVPMWGFSCGAVVTGSTATCRALNPTAGTGWSPVVITVPTGAGGLTINLTNSLSFANGNSVPTSITFVGQVGAGLGASSRATTPSPVHATQQVTWPTANSGPTFVPPPQGPRVQSFATEVAAGATTPLTWAFLRPGTYLIESGTHPSIQGPMGLVGILVVTAAPATGPGPTALAPIVETAPGCAYPAPLGATNAACVVPYDAEVPILLSEIDPLQNTEVSTAVNLPGFSETTVWSGQPGGCGNPTTANAGNCYPPAVNYTPLYYMVNGVAFDKTRAANSLFPISLAAISPTAGTGGTGSILVRVVNAGLHMHVPAIVGAQVAGQTGATNPLVTGFKVMAEDGHPLPGLPKVKTEEFMAAGKVYDLMINAQSTTTSGTPPVTTIAPYSVTPAIFDRALGLSGNATERDAGMLAYIGTNGSALPSGGALATARANADTYSALVAGQTLTVSDPSKGVIANDVNVYGVTLLAGPSNGGTVTLNNNGTFTYVPSGTGTSDSFTYCANTSAATIAATVEVATVSGRPAPSVHPASTPGVLIAR
ncbi:MAG TPA: hypothetical protein VGI81_17470 [Tepidisphaeraceae bacterium]